MLPAINIFHELCGQSAASSAKLIRFSLDEFKKKVAGEHIYASYLYLRTIVTRVTCDDLLE